MSNHTVWVLSHRNKHINRVFLSCQKMISSIHYVNTSFFHHIQSDMLLLNMQSLHITGPITLIIWCDQTKTDADTYDDPSGPIVQWAVTGVGVTSDPSHISSAPVHFPWVVVKDELEGGGWVEHVACHSVKHTLRFPCGTTVKQNPPC